MSDRIDNIHETLNSVHEKLGRMESRLSDIHAEVKKTNGRVTSLEKWQWKIAAILGVLLFLASFFKDQIINLFSK